MPSQNDLLIKVEEAKQMMTSEFSKFSNRKINTVFFFYDLIKNADDTIGSILFEHFCTIYEEASLSHEQEAQTVISQEEVSWLEDAYDDIIEAKFQAVLKRKFDVKTFYQKIWYFIWKSDILSDDGCGINYTEQNEGITTEDKIRAYALYEIVRDKRIPYFWLSDGLNMANEEYRAKCAELASIKRQIRFILNAGIFDQKTEKASHITKLLDELDDFQDRTIAIVFLINELQNRRSSGSGEFSSLLSLLERI